MWAGAAPAAALSGRIAAMRDASDTFRASGRRREALLQFHSRFSTTRAT
ncbi:MAG: hypothetical protein AVDCRST_MAG77-1470 [uncultured Chloroflexi bacterium]|uniref:Uncharacterized protein n=1 Tax=uncultured Chloroflexota bacterium TaxID=166587 RepID=A0A6J4HY55_9CHLR|nr:MAG: hypothetical protein AVDCRST_MAG77-1470 [uncultured Chloroflexota bacterium]